MSGGLTKSVLLKIILTNTILTPSLILPDQSFLIYIIRYPKPRKASNLRRNLVPKTNILGPTGILYMEQIYKKAKCNKLFRLEI